MSIRSHKQNSPYSKKKSQINKKKTLKRIRKVNRNDLADRDNE